MHRPLLPSVRRVAPLAAALLAAAVPAGAAAAPRCAVAGATAASSLCWQVPRAVPATVRALSRPDVQVTLSAGRRLHVAAQGFAPVLRHAALLRPGRRVLLRLRSDAANGRLELLVDGRRTVVLRRPTTTGPAARTAAVGSRAPRRDASPAADAVRAFAPNSFWNRALADDARLAPESDAMVAELVRQITAHTPWLNTTRYSTPVYVAGPDVPTVRVTLDTDAPALQRAWAAVPIPATAAAAAGNDAHMVVWQPSSDRMWEFWAASRQSDGWHARWGGATDGVSRDPGVFDAATGTTGWGATATGLPLIGGLVTLDDLRRGRIDHALALSVVEARKGGFVWPAQRDDGTVPGGLIPEGTRFRLDPAVDVDALSASPFVKMLARAAQDHGILVRDTGGSVAFYGEDPTPTGADPWPAVWQGGWPDKVLRGQFPWSHLQVVDPSVR